MSASTPSEPLPQNNASGAASAPSAAAAAPPVAAASSTSAPASPPPSAGADPAGATAAPFPAGFLWGSATAAYQIEGAATEDGRGPSVWDVFSNTPGKVFEGHTGNVACDHYHRYKEDLGLLAELGAKSYRFSVSWTRVLPEGTGKVNPKGLDFYDRLVDELLRLGITPMCTLFHWDFPQALQDRGGFLQRDVADWFADYTTVVARRLGDRVPWWVTQNEPQAFIGNALLEGHFAPGLKLPYREYLTAAHNQMRAHGKQVDALRAAVKAAKIGYVLATQVQRPATEDPGDVEAAREAIFSVYERHPWNNAWWIAPVLEGRYPESGLRLFGDDMPDFPASDFDQIKRPIDYLGLNMYSAGTWRQGKDGKPERVASPPGYPRATLDWLQVVPSTLYWGSRYFWERYKLPIGITEHGTSTRDQVFLDGKVHDPQRIDLMHRYLLGLARAVKEGVPVIGYWAWSLLDNFEWAEGYKERFGLVYVDYQTQRRIPKDSFSWYKEVIATNGRSLLGPTAVAWENVTG
ncbi:GH1 family beta-glucosidase [Sorangium sp. So ce1014]|uniref:GH1 family beta-glucosidase n=1 Tax=Sorangium sp. So ce1014 TaxID=3133326 RepID=UPI003F5EAF6C